MINNNLIFNPLFLLFSLRFGTVVYDEWGAYIVYSFN